MKKEYYLEDLKNDIYQVYIEKEGFCYLNRINQYYFGLDVVEDPEKVKAEKIAREREIKIDLILS
jgi:hypothetical protein